MDRASRLSVTVFFLILCFFETSYLSCATASDPPIGIFLSSKIRPYLQALHGLESKISFDYQVFDLSENFELAKHYAKGRKFQTCLAIGPEAINLLYQYGTAIPNKMAIMALDLKKFLGNHQVCGIDLRIPIEFQMEILRQKFGPGRKIAILFNQEENGLLIQKAKTAATQNNLRLISLQVDSPAQIMGKLDPVLKEIDIILFIPDSVVISEKIVTHITKTALIKGVAVCGFNRFFYESGALLSFIIDYEEVGRQAARLLEKLAKEHVCIFTPPNVHLLWNLRAFRMLVKTRPDKWEGIEVPKEGKE